MKKLLFTLSILAGFAMQATAQSFQSGDLLYSVISSNPPCVSLDGHVDGTNAQGELVIPETVEHEGVSYAVTEIGDRAFLNCSGLTGHLVIPSTIDTIQIAAFYGCSGFTGSLVIPNAAVLKEHVFQNCSGFSNLILPDDISEIPRAAFANCSGFHEDLVFPESVRIIGEKAFYGCSSFGGLVLPEGLFEIREMAFKDCTGFSGTLDLPESLGSIKYAAFCNCTGFSGDIVIPNSVIEVGNTNNNDYFVVGEPPQPTFADCFDHLVLPESLTTIGFGCFTGCSRLSGDLEIPRSVKKILYHAFYGCSGFESIKLHTLTPPIMDNSFDCPLDFPIYIPCNTLELYQNALGWRLFTNFIEDCSLVVDEEGSVEVRVYPNPASDFVTIEGIEAVEMQVFNAVGQLVETVHHTNQIVVSGWAKGLYVVKIMGNDGTVHTKRIAVVG